VDDRVKDVLLNRNTLLDGSMMVHVTMPAVALLLCAHDDSVLASVSTHKLQAERKLHEADGTLESILHVEAFAKGLS
jgi:hypothetical protein